MTSEELLAEIRRLYRELEHFGPRNPEYDKIAEQIRLLSEQLKKES